MKIQWPAFISLSNHTGIPETSSQMKTKYSLVGTTFGDKNKGKYWYLHKEKDVELIIKI